MHGGEGDGAGEKAGSQKRLRSRGGGPQPGIQMSISRLLKLIACVLTSVHGTKTRVLMPFLLSVLPCVSSSTEGSATKWPVSKPGTARTYETLAHERRLLGAVTDRLPTRQHSRALTCETDRGGGDTVVGEDLLHIHTIVPTRRARAQPQLAPHLARRLPGVHATHEHRRSLHACAGWEWLYTRRAATSLIVAHHEHARKRMHSVCSARVMPLAPCFLPNSDVFHSGNMPVWEGDHTYVQARGTKTSVRNLPAAATGLEGGCPKQSAPPAS